MQKNKKPSESDSSTDTKPSAQEKKETIAKSDEIKSPEVSIITEKPIDTSQYASQMADSLIKPL